MVNRHVFSLDQGPQQVLVAGLRPRSQHVALPLLMDVHAKDARAEPVQFRAALLDFVHEPVDGALLLDVLVDLHAVLPERRFLRGAVFCGGEVLAVHVRVALAEGVVGGAAGGGGGRVGDGVVGGGRMDCLYGDGGGGVQAYQ